MNRNVRWLALATLVAVAGCQESDTAATSSGSSSSTGTSTTTGSTATGTTPTTQAPAGQEVTMPSGLKYQDIVIGTGAEAVSGKTVMIHYTGKLTDGRE